MKYAVDKEPKYLLFQVQEEKVDATLSPELKTTFVTLHAEGMKNLILDMHAVKYVDSSGLSALLIANRLCKESEGVMVMARISDHVMKLIKISQLDKVLTILPTIEEAVEMVYMTELENDLKRDAAEE
ncbi:MAG TPA: anti-anti-sigma factor [Microscillaceae bacterium]|jgi:anti-anti-sigma factor|nr:anti-anti-sigma factor [Microscillaceae bacterium]